LSVRKHKKESWIVDVKVGQQRVRRVVKGRRKDAVAEETEIRRLINKGITAKNGLEQGLHRYLTEYAVHTKDYKGQLSRARQIRPLITGKTFDDVPDVVSEIKQINRKPATINRFLALLRRICSLAFKEWGWIEQPVGQKISMLPENNQRHIYLDKETLHSLVDALLTKGCKNAVMVAAYTGLRLGEIFKAEKITTDEMSMLFVEDTKAGKPRVVPMHEEIEGIEFPLETTKTILRKEFTWAKDAIERPEIRFHDLRHTFASFLVSKGVDMRTVGELLGHSQAQTTKRYQHLNTEMLNNAVRKI
jgi:integrase